MIIRVYMHWLYILLCAYRFIYKYRCLKAKVIKTNFLGNDMPKKICIILALLAKTVHKFIQKSVNMEPKNTNVQTHKLKPDSDSESSDPDSDSDSDVFLQLITVIS